MKLENSPYSKSYYIFPGIDVSEDVNSLKQLYVTVNLGPSPNISKDGRILLKIGTQGERYKTNWFGDCIEIKDPITNKYIFFGFINNYLIGYGNFPFEFIGKSLKKLKIESKEIDEKNLNENNENGLMKGFYLSIPYKKYKSSFNFSKFITNFDGNGPNYYNIRKLFKPSIDWKQNAPKIFYEDLENLWLDSWVLHRINTFNPENFFEHNWTCPSRFSETHYDKLAMWDTIHIIEDLKWYDIETASNMIKMHFGLFRESDGMAARDRVCGSKLDGNNYKDRFQGNSFKMSQPPLWSYAFMELSKMVGDYGLGEDALEQMGKNIEWWERNRFIPEYNLFGYNSFSPREIGRESGLDNSPRFYNQFDGFNWKKISEKEKRKLITVDLNSQMADYYQNLGVFAMINEDERMPEYFSKAEHLIDSMQEFLWDDKNKFFFDFDFDRNIEKRQPIFAASSFWSLFGGCVLKGKLTDFLENLTDPKLFWTELPVPSVAVNSPFYTTESWSGPSWISQNYWIILGLRRYNMGSLASELAKKCLVYLENSYLNYSKIFQFYNPISISQSDLSNRDKIGPYPNYIGHFPLHSLFYYGIMGAEILDNDINFIPNWNSLKTNNVDFEFYYNKKKYSFKPKKKETKIIEIHRDEIEQ
ncbi:MAG: hypothetical protein GY870_06250 [archaeon]|nr:hypothetical protein [archaeon]